MPHQALRTACPHHSFFLSSSSGHSISSSLMPFHCLPPRHIPNSGRCHKNSKHPRYESSRHRRQHSSTKCPSLFNRRHLESTRTQLLSSINPCYLQRKTPRNARSSFKGFKRSSWGSRLTPRSTSTGPRPTTSAWARQIWLGAAPHSLCFQDPHPLSTLLGCVFAAARCQG